MTSYHRRTFHVSTGGKPPAPLNMSGRNTFHVSTVGKPPAPLNISGRNHPPPKKKEGEEKEGTVNSKLTPCRLPDAGLAARRYTGAIIRELDDELKIVRGEKYGRLAFTSTVLEELLRSLQDTIFEPPFFHDGSPQKHRKTAEDEELIEHIEEMLCGNLHITFHLSPFTFHLSPFTFH